MITLEFEIRRYKKKELARLYRPDTPTDAAAVELLRRDINRCWELKEALEKLPSTTSMPAISPRNKSN